MEVVTGNKPQKPRTCELANWNPKPNTGLEDTTNYLIAGEKHLSPGVRLEVRHMATTCGVRLRNPQGDIRITIANHGFAAVDDDEIWHLDGNGYNGGPIGLIKERDEAEDIVLWKLVDSLPFNNLTYFAAESPRQLRLLRGGGLAPFCTLLLKMLTNECVLA